MSDSENRETYGKCNNPHGHGHNYGLEITVSGRVDESTGMVCNLAYLDEFVEREVLERFGHENLNCLSEFEDVVPTTENLCTRIYGLLESGFSHAAVEKIRLEETLFNSFEYAGGAELLR